MLKKDVGIIKDLLNETLNRNYNIEFSKELTDIINNYNEGDIYEWDDEKVRSVFNMVKDNFQLSGEPNEEAMFEKWYIEWYLQAIEDNKIE